MLTQMIRFGGVGGLATLAHVLCAIATEQAMQLSHQQANLAGFLVAVLVSYFGHSHFTFQSGKGSSDRFLRFAIVAIAGYAASSLTVALVTQGLGLPFSVAMAAVAIVVPASSFVAMRFWVFAAGPAQSRSAIDLALTAILGLGVVVLFWGRPANHDVAWYLVAARAWQGGAGLYTDLIEVNPPLNFYFTLPALWIASVTGFSDTNAHYVSVGALFFASLLWCAAILRLGTTLTLAQRALALLVAFLVVLLPSMNGLGQRDQIFVLSLLPWALHQALPRTASRGRTVASTLFAACGMCLKPYFVLLPMAVTVLNCVEQRSLRPVVSLTNFLFLLSGLAYVVFVRFVHPTYFSETVGTALLVYGAYGKPWAEVLAGIAAPMGILLLAFILIFRMKPPSRPVRIFVALSLGGLVSYFLQGTGFSYHKVPFLAFGAIACFAFLLQETRPTPQSMVAGLALFTVVAGGLTQGFYRNNAVPEIVASVSRLGPVDGVLTLSSHVYTGVPVALALNTTWASSYPAQWLVPGAVNRLASADCDATPDLCARLREVLAKNRTDIISDMTRARPELLVVDRNSGYFDLPPFDWLAFMAEDPAWLPINDQYRLNSQTGRFLFLIRKSEKTPP